jgi:DNA-binding protein YbaB
MTRIYVPLDKDMTDEEIVQALKDAAAKHNAEKEARTEAEGSDKAPSAEGADE